MLRESHKKRIQEEIGNNEIETGKGLNQEISLVRAGDTRWNSHLKTIVSLIALFPEVIQVLEYVEDDGDNGASRLQAKGLLSYLKTFEFVFYMHLISTILGLTNSLSHALQRKDEDILEAIDLIGTTKGHIQMLRENGFDQIREFGDRFGEISTDLLQNMAALNPCISFSQFNKSNLLKLSQMYPRDFEDKERIILKHELDIYYHSVYNDVRFANLNGIAELARLMVQQESIFLILYSIGY
ncbi:uncharacterized protein LOC112508947 [Cynara cardunculus var. scolymus]|uniref:uncharacterized protein LOC112508947 n=1 Tax=Cynara cardunculus var. scolymus TaxID=59895 RepID=UPI000D62B586|nr:uncharacterized protein LOC112508947 [Cynara cardunculus var. scolymus]